MRPGLVVLCVACALSALSLPAHALTADDVVCSKCVGGKDIAKNAVTNKKIRKNAITSKTIKNRSVKKKDLHPSVTAGPKNVLYVATRGGDFKNPRIAVNSITDASSTNPYLVHIGPGVYELGATTLQMKPFVDIRGAGVNATLLRGNIEGDSGGGGIGGKGVVTGAADATLSHLSVEHTGGVTAATAILATDSVTLTHLAARSTGAEQAIGIALAGGTPTVSDVHVTVEGGLVGFGLAMIGGRGDNITVEVASSASFFCLGALFQDARIDNLVSRVTGCSGQGTAISAENGANLRHVTAEVLGGTNATGIEADDAVIYGAVVSALGGSSENIGAELKGTSSLTSARLSAAGAGAEGLVIDDSGVRITSTLASSVDDNSGGTQCRNVYDLADLTVIFPC